jgi:hypothetical protein
MRLRRRLSVLVVIALVPSLLLTAYNAVRWRIFIENETRATALSEARFASSGVLTGDSEQLTEKFRAYQWGPEHRLLVLDGQGSLILTLPTNDPQEEADALAKSISRLISSAKSGTIDICAWDCIRWYLYNSGCYLRMVSWLLYDRSSHPCDYQEFAQMGVGRHVCGVP